jgi:acetyl esterase/lipase
LQKAASLYAGMHRLNDPFISPLFGVFTGLPPVLIQMGEHEILHDEVLALATALRASGVTVRMQIGRGMWHVFPLFDCPESRAAFAHARTFIEAIRRG